MALHRLSDFLEVRQHFLGREPKLLCDLVHPGLGHLYLFPCCSCVVSRSRRPSPSGSGPSIFKLLLSAPEASARRTHSESKHTYAPLPGARTLAPTVKEPSGPFAMGSNSFWSRLRRQPTQVRIGPSPILVTRPRSSPPPLRALRPLLLLLHPPQPPPRPARRHRPSPRLPAQPEPRQPRQPRQPLHPPVPFAPGTPT